MPQETFTAEKQKIEKEIQKLQQKMRTLQTRQRRPVITSIVRSMLEYDISPEEVTEAYQRRAQRATRASTPREPLPAKYRNVATGDEWTGRGRPPRWITEAEAKGKSREEFLIK
ncbi:MAG TPA: H-NS histone family protein [Candidatus Paenalcaligenes intestinipullorum]|uniref:H-NS histone family protein n=1 Tax=Candidatus Paenalcaligenes intestinipullorum TaxID=2838718 RepID=A0A9D2RL54_9BURK|nr:H-NS histone family protein [Candidatus Paenalcaligenes intestinipullorum]